MYKDNAEVISYDFRNNFKQVIIVNFDHDHNAESPNGFDFVMSMQEVRTTAVRRVELSPLILTPNSTPGVSSKSKQQKREEIRKLAKLESLLETV